MHIVVVEVDAVVGEEHLEDVVALDGRAGDRPEDADPRGRAAERFEHPQRNRRLAGMTFCRSDVDALRHGLSLWGRRGRPGRSPEKSPDDTRRCLFRAKERLSANPAEPGYPCYVSVLGELAWMPPRGELTQVYPLSRERRSIRSVGQRGHAHSAARSDDDQHARRATARAATPAAPACRLRRGERPDPPPTTR